MKKAKAKKRIAIVSLSEENYLSAKQFAEITGISFSKSVDISIKNRIPSKHGLESAEFLVADALACSSVNLSENDFRLLLDRLINIFEKLKNTAEFHVGEKAYLDLMLRYFEISKL